MADRTRDRGYTVTLEDGDSLGESINVCDLDVNDAYDIQVEGGVERVGGRGDEFSTCADNFPADVTVKPCVGSE